MNNQELRVNSNYFIPLDTGFGMAGVTTKLFDDGGVLASKQLKETFLCWLYVVGQALDIIDLGSLAS